MSEKETEKAILAWLDSSTRVAKAWSNDQDRTRARRYVKANKKKGVADICGFLDNGLFLAIEVKEGGNKPSADQAEFLRLANEAGAVAFAAWSLEDVILQFKARGL